MAKSPGEIAREKAEAAGRPYDWEEFLPSLADPLPKKTTSSPSESNQSPEPSIDRPWKDAKRLYDVADRIYQALIIFNWIFAAVGIISALIIVGISIKGEFSGSGFVSALGILLFTGFVCLINYSLAVLSTHFAKVLSNISLTLLGIKAFQSGDK